MIHSIINEYNLFLPKQKQVLQYSYEQGKPFNLGYTLAAIAWVESKAGKYRINLQDQSAGVYHCTIDQAIKRLPNLTDSNYDRNRIAQTLIDDDKLASAIAIEMLLEWKHIRPNWSDVVASYHGGSNYRSNRAQNYLQLIRNRIEVLRLYIKE